MKRKYYYQIKIRIPSYVEQESLLTFAINNPKIMEYLLENGDDPNETNSFNKTPLMYAAQFNKIKTAQLLLKFNADVNIKTNLKDADNCNVELSTTKNSALHYAARYSNQFLMKLLVDNKALIKLKNSQNQSPRDYFNNYKNNTRFKNNKKFKFSEKEIQEIKNLLKP